MRMRKVFAVMAGALMMLFAGAGTASAAGATTTTETATQIIGYGGTISATATVTTVDNRNFDITNGTLVAQTADPVAYGYGGWVDTFTYTLKYNKDTHVTTFTGTVTLTTPYATDTRTVTFDPLWTPPFKIDGGTIVLDSAGFAGQAYRDLEVQMVYGPGNLPYVNALYWF